MKDICPFRFNGNDLVIDESILTYPVFKRLYDLDGSKDKATASKYLTYVYHAASRRCVPVKRGFSEKETRTYCTRIAQFAVNTILPLKELDAAVLFYKDHFILPVEEQADQLAQALNRNIKITRKINERISEVLDSEAKLSTEQISEFIKLQKELLTLAEQMPKQIALINQTEALIAEQTNAKEIGRGGKEIEDSMDGNPDIEG
jgi:hypothetical protein